MPSVEHVEHVENVGPTNSRGQFHLHLSTRCVRAFCTGAVLTLGLLTLAIVAVTMTSSGRAGLRAFGNEVLIVRSGSMSPTFDTGDAVIIRSLDAEEVADLRPGRIVTFRPADSTVLVTHRIVDVVENDSGGVSFTTKGDANESADSRRVASTDVIGVYRTNMPRAGFLLFALQRPRLGFVLLSALLLAHLAVLMTREPITRTQQQKAGMQ
ncbi:MAG: hypothetical protein RLZ19_243 [Actinomycetota bacterium]